MSKESRAGYYERAFEDLEKFKVNTWNWAAFFFGLSWMLYRKMYLYVILCACAFTLVMSAFEVMGITEHSMVSFIELLLACSFHIYLGGLGNSLYYDVVKAKIRKGYHLLDKYCPTSLSSILFFEGFVFIWIAEVISRSMQLKKYYECEVTTETIRAYLEPSKEIPFITLMANIVAFGITVNIRVFL